MELRAEAAARAEIVLDRTPFYAESGGQVADTGVLRTADGSALFDVDDVQRVAGTQTAGLTVHRGILHGSVRVGDVLRAEVDAERRAHTMRNHTGTHLLHRALRNVVGERARQAGSLVTPDYLRFDFPFDRGLTDDEKLAIEREVRRVVREDREVGVEWMTMAEAQGAGADAFFDEKYGERVRTIRVAGLQPRAVRRNALPRVRPDRQLHHHRRAEHRLGHAPDRGRHRGRGGPPDGGALRPRRAHRRRGGRPWPGVGRGPDHGAPGGAARHEAASEGRRGGGRPAQARGHRRRRRRTSRPASRSWAPSLDLESIDVLKGFAKDVRGSLPSGVIALGLDADEPQLFVTVSDDLVARGIAAGPLVQGAVTSIDGRGGGRPEMAQGKGTRREGLGDAIAAVRAAVADRAAGA